MQAWGKIKFQSTSAPIGADDDFECRLFRFRFPVSIHVRPDRSGRHRTLETLVNNGIVSIHVRPDRSGRLVLLWPRRVWKIVSIHVRPDRSGRQEPSAAQVAFLAFQSTSAPIGADDAVTL